jgi:hypothetical protein
MEHLQLDTSFFFTSDICIKYLHSSYLNIAFIIYNFQSISVLVIYVRTHLKQMKELSENHLGCLRCFCRSIRCLQSYIHKYPILRTSHECKL